MEPAKTPSVFWDRWARFSEYEVRDGYLRPTPGASLEYYDPWELYEQARIGRHKTEGPHESFINLPALFPPGFDEIALALARTRGQAPIPQTAQEVLTAWAKRFGLLGLPLLAAKELVLAPRWEANGATGLTPCQTHYWAVEGGWRGGTHIYSPGIMEASGWEAVDPREGDVVVCRMPADDRGSACTLPWDEPHALLFERGSWDRATLRESWGRFFPDVPDDEKDVFPYPMPLTEEFWRSYAEPVHSMWFAARDLATIAGLLAAEVVIFDREPVRYQEQMAAFEREDRTAEAKALREARWNQRGEAAERLGRIFVDARPRLVASEDDSFSQRWTSGSLLGTFALMLSRDMIERKQWVRLCRTCRRYFVTENYQQLSCSDRCTWNLHKRKVRADERFLQQEGPQEAWRMAQEGMSAAEIRASLQARVDLNLSRQRVRGWLNFFRVNGPKRAAELFAQGQGFRQIRKSLREEFYISVAAEVIKEWTESGVR